MRVRFKAKQAGDLYKVIIGDCVAMTAYPMAFIVGAAGHPDGLAMVAGTIFLALACGSAIYMLMMTWMVIKMLLTVAVVWLVSILRRLAGGANRT